MSDAQGVEAQPPEDPTPGALLKQERERRALSIVQAAEDLHLDPSMVEAIEANRFQALGAPVYARGHLRKYAAHLGLPAEEIIERYERLQDRPVVTDPIPAALADPVRSPRRSLKVPFWIATGLLVLALGAWIAFEMLSANGPPAAIETPLSAANDAPAPEVSVQSEQTTVQSVESPAPASPAATYPPAETAEPSSSEAVSATQAVATSEEAGQVEPIQVRLEFSGESWTEVYDATGTRLMYAMGTAGGVRTLTGVPPLQVTLGSVSAVNMQVNGEGVAIPRRHAREATRFTIDREGNLR